MYASYLMEVLNDKEDGNEMLLKAKESANIRTNFELNGVGSDMSSMDGIPCAYISAESDRLGKINQCNMSLCKVFGY